MNEKSLIIKKGHRYLIPKAYWKRIIKKYCSDSNLRIYSDFIIFMDQNMLKYNKEVLAKIFQLKKKKMLNEEDLIIFRDLVRMYDPRKLSPDLETNSLKSRVKRLCENSGGKIPSKITSKGWKILSEMLHEKVTHLSLLIETYLLKTHRKALSSKDIPELFPTSLDFLL